MKNVSEKVVEKIKTRHFMFSNFFFRKSCLLWNNVEIFCGVRQATYDSLAHSHCILYT